MSHPRAEEVFLNMIERPAAERGGLLELLCGQDVALRTEVESLLRADAVPASLERPPIEPMPAGETLVAPQPIGEKAGDIIGRFKLLQQIGEGGFGVVFMAEQREPVQRRVALKIIKVGMDTKAVIARFEAERQALALMDHPNIARVLDAGATASGRPYFVMELVTGEPITNYCDRHNLKIADRLDLFMQACSAVQHAHQKGVIHRDIKPANVLVSTLDGRPHAKVIDFGIAKATNARLTEKTLFTEMRQLIGTPEYMSPEQAEGSLDIDTRTDVYALGVLLYELLTGATPFDPERLRSAAYAEIQRIIREDEPPRPSLRISKLGTTRPDLATHRGTQMDRLRALLRGDLDWIVMKCLEKERARRYETASSVALDIQRHLAGEPVVAAPPSAAYKMRKFVHRHRAGVAASMAIVAALVGGVIVSASMYLRAQTERERAEQQEKSALAAMSYMQRIIESADPTRVGKEVKIGDLLDQYTATLDKEFPGQPGVEAAVRTKLAEFYKLLDMFEGRGTKEKYHRAARHNLEAALDLRLRTLGDEHPFTLAAMSSLAALHQEQGKPSEAESLYRRGLEISRRVHGEEAPDTLTLTFDLANCLRKQGNPGAAEPLARSALEARRRLLGDEGEGTLASKIQLAGLLQDQGNLPEAEPLFRTVWEVRRSTVGDADDHKETRYAMAGLANVLLAQGRLVEAERLYGDTKVPEDLGIKQWFQGEINPYGGRATLLVFWEEWCPYVQRDVPLLEKRYGKYKDRDLRMIVLTRLTRSATEEKMRDFIRKNNLSLPVAREDGTATAFFNKGEGVPAAAVVKGGKLVWRGYPTDLTDETLDALLR